VVSLSSLINRDLIQLSVPFTEKEELLHSLVERLAEQGSITDPERVLDSLLERERVMSTGIGSGVAIPHAQCPAANRLTVSLARPSKEIDFESLDDLPVRLVFLVVGPEERGGFIRILARISRLLYTGELQQQLLDAGSPDDVIRILSDAESVLEA